MVSGGLDVGEGLLCEAMKDKSLYTEYGFNTVLVTLNLTTLVLITHRADPTHTHPLAPPTRIDSDPRLAVVDA